MNTLTRKLLCLIFSHEPQEYGNQNGTFLRCKRCGCKLGKIKVKHGYPKE